MQFYAINVCVYIYSLPILEMISFLYKQSGSSSCSPSSLNWTFALKVVLHWQIYENPTNNTTKENKYASSLK